MAQSQSTSNPSIRRPALHPRFSLLTLLKAVTVIGVLFAIMASVGAWWSWAVVLLALLVAGHVGGAWLGARLRDETMFNLRIEHAAAPRQVRPRDAQPDETPTHLQRRRSLGWTIPFACGLGAAACATTATIGMANMRHPSIPISAIFLGAISGGVIGGILGFLAASFWKAASLALGEASNIAPKSPRDPITAVKCVGVMSPPIDERAARETGECVR